MLLGKLALGWVQLCAHPRTPHLLWVASVCDTNTVMAVCMTLQVHDAAGMWEGGRGARVCAPNDIMNCGGVWSGSPTVTRLRRACLCMCCLVQPALHTPLSTPELLAVLIFGAACALRWARVARRLTFCEVVVVVCLHFRDAVLVDIVHRKLVKLLTWGCDTTKSSNETAKQQMSRDWAGQDPSNATRKEGRHSTV